MRRWPTVLAICVVAYPAGDVGAQGHARHAPADAPASLQLTAEAEPGTPLELRLRVVDARTGQPVARAGALVYQTDAAGRYTPEDPGNNREARIHGWLRSAGDGTAVIRTIVPGSYPTTRIPRHIHVVLDAEGYEERVFEIVFDDDPYVDARIRAQAARPLSAYELCTPEGGPDAFRCTVQIELGARGGAGTPEAGPR